MAKLILDSFVVQIVKLKIWSNSGTKGKVGRENKLAGIVVGGKGHMLDEV